MILTVQTVDTSSLWVVLGEHNQTTSSETNLTLRMVMKTKRMRM